MDVAKSIAAFRERSPEQWLKSGNRVLPPVVMAVLVLALARQAAELTWAITPHQAFDRPSPQIVQPARTNDAARSGANFSALADSHLFGVASEEPAEPVEPVNTVIDAPRTTLNLQLTGVIEDSGGKLSQAHIMSGRGPERRYALGETIENANGASVHAVYTDHVILNVSGRFERLPLPSAEESATANVGRVRPAPPPPPPPPAAAAEVPSQDPTPRSEPPAALTDIMRVAAQAEGGQMIGVRINPGRDRETFEALGFMPGDIVTEVNGIVLDDPSRALQIFDALRESTQASVTVTRDGVPNVMIIDTTRLQSLVDDRQ